MEYNDEHTEVAWTRLRISALVALLDEVISTWQIHRAWWKREMNLAKNKSRKAQTTIYSTHSWFSLNISASCACIYCILLYTRMSQNINYHERMGHTNKILCNLYSGYINWGYKPHHISIYPIVDYVSNWGFQHFLRIGKEFEGNALQFCLLVYNSTK